MTRAKLILMTVALVAVGAGVLTLRQRRVALAHEAAVLRGRLVEQRRELWNAHADTCERLRPRAIRRRIERTPLALEPVGAAGPTGTEVAERKTPSEPTRR